MLHDISRSFLVVFIIILVKIFSHQFSGFFNFSAWSLLRFLLKSIEQHHKIAFVETTKYPEDIASKFYSNLEQTIYPFNILE